MYLLVWLKLTLRRATIKEKLAKIDERKVANKVMLKMLVNEKMIMFSR
jgi:hypothetical protein